MKGSPISDALLIRAIAKLDKLAFGTALGLVCGLVVFLATNILILRGGDYPVGPNLALLGQFFIGYGVTFSGSLIGLAYGFATGFALGWLTAYLHNLLVTVYLFLIQFKANMTSISDYIDPDHVR